MTTFRGSGQRADVGTVDLGLDGRPGAVEIAWVLAACALVFVLLVHFDGAASHEETTRARAALAKRAAAARRPAPAAETRRAGDESLGNAGPISVPVFSAWSAGTSTAAGHDRVAGGAFQPPGLVLAVLAAFGAALALTGSMLIARTRR